MTQDQIDEEIGTVSIIINYALQIRGNKQFAQGLLKRASEYRQSLRVSPELYLDCEHEYIEIPSNEHVSTYFMCKKCHGIKWSKEDMSK